MTSLDPTPALSRHLATHIAALNYAALPPKVEQMTRRALLDALGVMLGASGLAAEAKPFHALALASPGPARLLAGGTAAPEAAALANGALAHALDFGDVFDLGPAHPNAALVPAVLALADLVPVTYGALLTAMAAGSDLACRMSLAGVRTFEEGGWYPPPLVGTIGAAAGCARLLDLDADGVVQAMGLAMLSVSFPAEIKYDGGGTMRAVREGFAAKAAVGAALLARSGARAFAEPLAGKGGFFAVYAGGVKADLLCDQLGTRFMGAEISFKPWPACRGTHAYIEAALALRAHCIVADIAAIHVETGLVQEMLVAPRADKIRPASAMAAKFSIPFCVALALVDGAVWLDSFGDDKRNDPALLDLAAKVVAERNPAWGHAEASSGSLTLILKDGTRLHQAVPHARGHAGNPLRDADLIAKFTDCAARAVVPLRAEAARALAHAVLESPADMPVEEVLRALG